MIQQILPIIVTFVNYGEIEENFFSCKELPETSKGQETKGLTWENCVGICSDDAPSMIGSTRGFAALVKKKKEKKRKSSQCHNTERCWFQKLLEMK
jgi:hypothetical protein